MTAPATIRGTQLLVSIGDGNSPEIFTHPCLINAERGITFTSTANQEVIPDCDNPEDPGWQTVTKDGFSATITGAGMLDTDALEGADGWDAWMRTDDSKNIRVYVNDIGYWAGAFKLTEFAVAGERGRRATVNVTLISDGEVGAFVAT